MGGEGLGGGLYMASGTVVLQGVLVIGNRAQGGTDGDGNTTGQGLGGGVYVDPSGERHHGHGNLDRRQPGLHEQQQCVRVRSPSDREAERTAARSVHRALAAT